MTAQELEAWAAARHAGLADFTTYAESYLNRRIWPGSAENDTNQHYSRFLEEAADLLAALDEIREAAAQEAANQEEEQEQP
jgi:hypothetical protein